MAHATQQEYGDEGLCLKPFVNYILKKRKSMCFKGDTVFELFREYGHDVVKI